MEDLTKLSNKVEEELQEQFKNIQYLICILVVQQAMDMEM